MDNRMYVEFDSISNNESLARIMAAAFLTRLNPTLEELDDVRTAVSEAVTNAIIHGYEKAEGTVCMECQIHNNVFTVSVSDNGVGIEDIEKAKEPLFTTRAEEDRSGMGFSFMEIFMDSLLVESEKGKGTKVTMTKRIGADTVTSEAALSETTGSNATGSNATGSEAALSEAAGTNTTFS